MCKMGEEPPLDQERYLFIYTKICLGFSSQMGLVPCLMGLARGSRSTPTMSINVYKTMIFQELYAILKIIVSLMV